MKKAILCCLLLALVPVSTRAAILVGYEYTDAGEDPCAYNPLFGCAPEAPGYVWKAFRAKAVLRGYIDHFKLYVVSAPGDPTEIGWAVYEDNQGRIGAKKAAGHFHGSLSPGENIFPVTKMRRPLVRAGRHYWITFHTSLGNQVYIQRGRAALCADDRRMGTNSGGSAAWTLFSAPPFSSFVNSYGNGCYGWAVESR